jgi:hypothetical protein
MIQVLNQFRRVFVDNGSGDKDFTEQETKLREAQQKLLEATKALNNATEILRDLVMARSEPLH